MSESFVAANIQCLFADAVRSCGSNDVLFRQIFSSSVDLHYPQGSVLREIALAFAAPLDYMTAQQHNEEQVALVDDGSCRHGFDRMCCPLGCDDQD